MTFPSKTCQIKDRVTSGKGVVYKSYLKYDTKAKAIKALCVLKELDIADNNHKIISCNECKGFHIINEKNKQT